LDYQEKGTQYTSEFKKRERDQIQRRGRETTKGEEKKIGEVSERRVFTSWFGRSSKDIASSKSL
jgi:hypothetical protein